MGHAPRKRFGQNFLKDKNAIGKIINAVTSTDPEPQARVVEIGPGMGALTMPLLAHYGKLDVIEIDRDLAETLRQDHPDTITVHETDVLDADIDAIAADDRIRLVGNLPYNISTPLLFHVLESRDKIIDMHFMLQLEVVQRMAAQPGGKDYGRLTVMHAAVCTVKQLFKVGPGAFFPPPKVQSAVARLVPHDEAPFPIDDSDLFADVVAAAFNQRRKTLRQSLKQIASAEHFDAANIDSSLRAEKVSPEEFARLSNVIAKNPKTAQTGD